MKLWVTPDAAQLLAEFCQRCIADACQAALKSAELSLYDVIYALLKPMQASLLIMRALLLALPPICCSGSLAAVQTCMCCMTAVLCCVLSRVPRLYMDPCV